jgi:hypothetical protein
MGNAMEAYVELRQFDALTRSCDMGTRRGVLQLLAASGVGAALLGRIGIESAAAGCVKPGKKCKKNGKKQKCCGGAKCSNGRCRCKNGGTSCGALCCQPGQVCQDGAPDLCVNGPLAPGDVCDPDKPLSCASGKCACT